MNREKPQARTSARRRRIRKAKPRARGKRLPKSRPRRPAERGSRAGSREGRRGTSRLRAGTDGGKSEHDGAKPEQTPTAAGSFEVARVLKVAKPLMRGDDVKALQTALIERNYHCGTNGADGTYGRLTAYAVRCFQASKGLIVNGRADRYTIAALGGTWKE